MQIALMTRTLLVAAWLTGMVVYAGAKPGTCVLAGSLLLLWVVPFARGRHQHRLSPIPEPVRE
jgi:hypothetical protein